MAKPTLLDIAKLSGVSPSTVSLVLSNKGKISQEVQDKVRSAAEELGYIKSVSSVAGKSRKIAVLFHFDQKLAQTWHFLRKVTLSLQNTLDNHNYLTILIPITFSMSDEEIFKRVVDSNATAVFSMHFGRENLFNQLEEASIPVVIIINSHYQTQFYTVCADNFQGSYEAASHLLNLGHTNILYADFDIYQLPATISDRFFGFYKALNEHSITLPEEHKLHFDIKDVDDIREKFRKAFSGSKKPTAIFFVDDFLAAHSIGILRDLGLECPKDVSIIASGEVLDYNEPYIPRITGMLTSPELLGKFSAEMMLNRLKNQPRESYVLKIKQQLMDRGSCRKI